MNKQLQAGAWLMVPFTVAVCAIIARALYSVLDLGHNNGGAGAGVFLVPFLLVPVAVVIGVQMVLFNAPRIASWLGLVWAFVCLGCGGFEGFVIVTQGGSNGLLKLGAFVVSLSLVGAMLYYAVMLVRRRERKEASL